VRNKPATDQRLVQQPWFKGPKIAEQIPLAVDPGIRARLAAFKASVALTIDALKPKINRTGQFTASVYDRLADALEKAQDDEAGRKLLQNSRDFASGKIAEEVFVAYLNATLKAPAQRTARVSPERIGESTTPKLGDTKTLNLARGVKLELVWIPPGEFMMGSNDEEDVEKPAHRVKLTKGFWMGKYEVTQEQYEAVVGSNPSRFKGANNPVEQVTWDDAVAFCRKVGGRLPTEAEWEYACRAGTTTRYHSGRKHDDCERVGWTIDNSGETTHAVGGKQANAWGLHDVHGNVWEWCADSYGDYPSAEAVDPTGPDSGQKRVLRGGSWYDYSVYCRSTFRITGSRGSHCNGFRMCLDFP
jgi:formylglycine-generating enzyme required for sulfatase activity